MIDIRRYITLTIFLLLVGIFNISAGSIKITTDATKIGVGQGFHIIIEAKDCPGNLELSSLPPGVKKVYQGVENSSGFINGSVFNSTKLTLTCKGETPGQYKFGPVSIGNVKSNVISYTVVEGNGNGNGGANNQGSANSAAQQYDPNAGPKFIGKGNEQMFLRASVNKTNVYEQEAIEYTVKLYTTYNTIKFMGAAAAPKFEGFVMEEGNVGTVSFNRENFNGKVYATAVIARYIIFPQKTGNLQVLGNTYTVSADAEEYYHDPYFWNMTVKRPVQFNVTPNDININVKHLPTPIPADFMGGVGNFRITSSLPSRNLSTNMGGSLVYTIEGSGNIKYLKLPDITTFPKSLEVYPPTVTVDANVTGATVSGSAKFDYSIIPTEMGSFTIPAVTFSYFDPTTGEYKKMTAEGYPITVGKGKTSDKSQKAMTFNKELMPAGQISKNLGKPYVNSFLYWLCYIVPVLIFLISLIGYRKYLKDHEDLVQLRSKKANKMALKRLAKAYKSMRDHNEEQFYDDMLAALWGYIGDKLKMPTSELTRSNVGEEFEKHNVKESTFMPIINLIDECEYAKYTPVSRDANMKQLYGDALESLSKVESEYSELTAKPEENEDIDDAADNEKN